MTINEPKFVNKNLLNFGKIYKEIRPAHVSSTNINIDVSVQMETKMETMLAKQLKSKVENMDK